MSEKSGKLIAVWGAPHSGKTTFSASLATAIADTYAAATVIVLHCDVETPMLSVLFPNAKSGSLGSVGIPLSANELDTEQILANCTETKARPTLAVLGYRTGAGECRTLEQMPDGRFCFPAHPSASARVHFLPLGIADGIYTVFLQLSGLWTPAGQVSATVTVSIPIAGTVYDGFYIR